MGFAPNATSASASGTLSSTVGATPGIQPASGTLQNPTVATAVA